MNKRWSESDWYVPRDWLAILGGHLGIILGLWASFFLPWLTSIRHGNPTPLYAALVLATVGVVLLFFARLPLYRQRKYFVFGARHLSGTHRKLYRAAYVCIGAGVVMLGLVWVLLK